ncbi:VWA domain-containing protein [Pseudomonadales bacterium]|nr:VWA domain-containing protein [Pseudomonadales bacterium]
MDRKLVDFIRVLRNADVRVSTSESIDAMHAAALLGYHNRELLKQALSSTLAKSEAEKESFNYCFEHFFSAETPSLSQDSVEQWPAANENDLSASDDMPSDTIVDNTTSFEPDTSLQSDTSEHGSPVEASLANLLMANNSNDIAIAMAQAGEAIKVNNMQVFTQKGPYSWRMLKQMGMDELQETIRTLEQNKDPAQHRIAHELTERLNWLREQVRDFVEKKYLLFASQSGQKLREEVLKKARLSSLDRLYHRDMQLLVKKMAKKLASQHARRKRVFKKGQLNAGKTIARNISNDGIMFDTHWKSKRRDRPKVFAICDVSGSVALYSRFLLMLLYSLHEVLPKVRAFAFSNTLGEVSNVFAQYSIEKAIELVNAQWSMGSTDYGQAFEDFSSLCLDSIDNHSTIIILGDARNNYGDAKAQLLKTLYERSQRVIWINPESKSMWGGGDSEMPGYAAYCHDASSCNTLGQLENIVARLLRQTS